MTTIRAGICILLTFAVLAHGAVETWSESVLQIGAALLFLWWGFLMASGRRRNPLESRALATLGARAARTPAVRRSSFIVSVPDQARASSHDQLPFCFFCRDRHSARRANGGISPGSSFYWDLQWRFSQCCKILRLKGNYTGSGKCVTEECPYGPYVNRNHFAGLMELLIPMGLAMLAVPGVRRQQMPLMALLAAMPVGALLLSASRGGIIGFGCEVILLVVLLWIRRGEKKRLFTFLVALVLAGGLVAWLGVGQVIQRFSQIHNPEVTEGRRISMASGAYHIFRDHPWMGTGVGTLISVYPAYETAYDATIVDHVHDDHFELLAETGVWAGFVG